MLFFRHYDHDADHAHDSHDSRSKTSITCAPGRVCACVHALQYIRGKSICWKWHKVSQKSSSKLIQNPCKLPIDKCLEVCYTSFRRESSWRYLLLVRESFIGSILLSEALLFFQHIILRFNRIAQTFYKTCQYSFLWMRCIEDFFTMQRAGHK